jgi:hypothetical protein
MGSVKLITCSPLIAAHHAKIAAYRSEPFSAEFAVRQPRYLFLLTPANDIPFD